MFEVMLTSDARKFFERADAPLQQRLDRAFQALAHDPRHHNNIKSLKGKLKGYSRFRVGDWRVIFNIDDGKRQVWVLDIAHRSEVYE